MYHFITASKDATIYSQYPYKNTGMDSILEVQKTFIGASKYMSRALIEFDIDGIQPAGIPIDNVDLILYQTSGSVLQLHYNIYAYPVSQSWEMGNGYNDDVVSLYGASWNRRDTIAGTEWLGTNQLAPSSSCDSTGNGGTWYNEPNSFQSFYYSTKDIEMDVKPILLSWLSGSIENNGIILKYSGSYETNTNDYGTAKFFSKETNTIYQPKLRLGWDDQSFSTGSLSLLSVTDDIIVSISNFKKEYKSNSTQTLRLKVKNRYPVKTFATTLSTSNLYYIPSTSYYQIKDFESDLVIIPFSDYSKISCDSNGNYIKVDFTNWQNNRQYKVEFKVVYGDGSEYYIDNDNVFTLI